MVPKTLSGLTNTTSQTNRLITSWESPPYLILLETTAATLQEPDGTKFPDHLSLYMDSKNFLSVAGM